MDPIQFIPINVAINLDSEKLGKERDTDTDNEEIATVLVEPQQPVHYERQPIPTWMLVFIASSLIVIFVLFLASSWSILREINK